ncbi:hypothetical protein HDU96_006466 [Phlyctochytrium bullatum]|nr:hypothetical protein HDU96_006466 [Phlyctochytrium bullatum]
MTGAGGAFPVAVVASIPIPVVDIALSIVSGIIEIRRTMKEQDQKAIELLDRIESLEKPLQVLKTKSDSSNVYEQPLFKLVRNLEGTQAVLKQFAGQNTAKRILKVMSYQEKFASLSKSIDASLSDLQIALQAEEVFTKDQAALSTAEAILTAMETSRLAVLKESISVCVQCGNDFRESENAEGSCAFHPVLVMERRDWYSPYVLRCCGKDVGKEYEAFPVDGCSRGKHRVLHHNEVPYVNFLGHIRLAIQDAEPWLTVTQLDTSPDSTGSITATFGVLRNERVGFWITQFGTPVALATFDEVDIEAPTHFPDGRTGALIGPPVNEITTPYPSKRNAAIRRAGMGWYARGFWVIEGGRIVGVRVEVKSPSSAYPNVSELALDIDPLAPGKVNVLYDNAFSAFDVKPRFKKAYPVEAAVKKFREIPRCALEEQPPLPTFEQEGDLKARIKMMKPVGGNPEGSSYRADIFKLELMLISTANPQAKGSSTQERLAILKMVGDNHITVSEAERLLNAVENSVSGEEPVTIIETSVAISLDDGATWRPATGIEPLASAAFSAGADAGDGTAGMQPFTMLRLAGREVVKVSLAAWFDVKGKKRGWNNSVFLCRDAEKPVLVRVRFEEAFGKWASLVLPYRNPRVTDLPEKTPKDYLFVYVDDVDDLSRIYAKISMPNDSADSSDGKPLFTLIQYTGTTTTRVVYPNTLRLWVAEARQAATKIPGDGIFRHRIQDASDSRMVVTGLFDLARGCLWGLKVKVMLDDGGESFAEDTCVLPEDIF